MEGRILKRKKNQSNINLVSVNHSFIEKKKKEYNLPNFVRIEVIVFLFYSKGITCHKL